MLCTPRYSWAITCHWLTSRHSIGRKLSISEGRATVRSVTAADKHWFYEICCKKKIPCGQEGLFHYCMPWAQHKPCDRVLLITLERTVEGRVEVIDTCKEGLIYIILSKCSFKSAIDCFSEKCQSGLKRTHPPSWHAWFSKYLYVPWNNSGASFLRALRYDIYQFFSFCIDE